MTSPLAKFLALSRPDQHVLLAALLTLPLFWLGLRVVGFARLAAWSSRHHTSEQVLPRSQAVNVAKLVGTAAGYTIGQPTCLTRSLVLGWLLRRRGFASDLRIGVRKIAGQLDAHAWLELEGQPLNDVLDVADRYPPFNEPLSAGVIVAR